MTIQCYNEHRFSSLSFNTKMLSAETALAIVEAAHAAWNAGSVEGTLEKYVEDLVWVANTGAGNSPVVLHGKSAFREKFAPIMRALAARTTIVGFRFHENIAHIRVRAQLRHRNTGVEMDSSFREVAHFRGFRICRLEEFHDAALMATFWRLVAAAEGRSSASGNL